MLTTPIVNAHTHLELGWQRSICPQLPGEPFHEWIFKLIRRNVQARESGNFETLSLRSVERGIAALKAAGTTHVGDITLSGLSVEPLFASGLRGVVYVEVIGITQEVSMFRFEEARRMVEAFRPKQPSGMQIGITVHAPYSTHPDAIRASVNYCLENDVPMCVHAAESPFENEALLEESGPIYDIPGSLGADPPTFPRPGKTSIHYLDSLGILDTKPLLVHMVHATEEELDLVAASGSKIAHCPRSNVLLQCGTLDLKAALERNIPVALGTDSLASSPDIDVRNEAQFAVSAHMGSLAPVSVEALLQNAAVLD